MLALLAATALPAAARADDGVTTGGLRWAIDARLAVPDGLGATVTITPRPWLTAGLGAGTLLGTVALTPEATWKILPRRACSPTITAKLSTVIFTPLVDGVINDELARIYGDQVTVDMAGRTMEVAQGLGGVDCALARVHVIARAGYAWQVGSSFGGSADDGDLVLRDWHGPTLDLGLRWSL